MTEPLALAADIGGTAMRAALVDRSGALVARTSCPTEPERGLDDAAARLASMLTAVREDAGGREVVGAGVSTAGPVDPTSGEYRDPPNLPGWNRLSMQPALESALGLTVAVGHDATLTAMAEVEFGVGAGLRHLLYLTISTGIGAGIIANGQAVTGAGGGAGEAGHLIVEPGGPVCGAGCAGCLEAMASGTAIAAEARRRVEAGAQSIVLDEAGGLDAITARHVFQAAARGDAVSREVIDGAIGYLGIGLAGLLAVLDPELIVLGGGVVEGLRPYWEDLLRAVQTHALPRYAERVPLVVTPLGDSGSLLGAALLAFRRAEASS